MKRNFKMFMRLMGVGEPLNTSWDHMVFMLKSRKIITFLASIWITYAVVRSTWNLYHDKELVNAFIGYAISLTLLYLLVKLHRDPIITIELKDGRDDD